jgi:hypothetical protein
MSGSMLVQIGQGAMHDRVVAILGIGISVVRLTPGADYVTLTRMDLSVGLMGGCLATAPAGIFLIVIAVPRAAHRQIDTVSANLLEGA